jgi:hypothetical protein
MTVVAGIEDTGATNEPIQTSVLVHLTWEPALQIWVVDPSNLDGAPLDTPRDRMYPPYSVLGEAARRDWDRAEAAPVPTAHHLARMILAAAHSPEREPGDSYRKYLT